MRRAPSSDPVRRLHDLTTLNAIAQTLNRSVDLDAALGETLKDLVRLMDLSTGWIFLWDGNDAFRIAADHGLPPALAKRAKAPLRSNWCTCQSLYRDAELGASVENVVCSRLATASGETRGLRNHATVPLWSGDRFQGLMNVATTDWGLFTPEDLQLLSAVGNQMAVAIERARLTEQSRRLAALEERSRVARELHDSVTQTLFSLRLTAQAAGELAESDPARAREHVQRIESLAHDALTELRGLIEELSPSVLEERGLPEAIERLAARSAVPVHVTVNDGARPSPEVELAVYWIVREALHNAAKHAQAHRVVVRLDLSADDVVAEVTDDGVGFDAAHEGDGRGLPSMRARARERGATLTVASASAGNGTRILLRMPRQ